MNYLSFLCEFKNASIAITILDTTITQENQMHLYHIPPGKGWELLLGFYGLKKPAIIN